MAGKKNKRPNRPRRSGVALAASASFAFTLSIGVGLYFAGVFGSSGAGDAADVGIKTAEAAAEQTDASGPYFHTFPEMVVDLRTAHCRAPFLRFTLVVQIDEKNQSLIEAYNIRLKDSIQSHIRGYERRELVGVEGANRIRADMVNVINEVIGPDQVHAALFNNFILH